MRKRRKGEKLKRQRGKINRGGKKPIETEETDKSKEVVSNKDTEKTNGTHTQTHQSLSVSQIKPKSESESESLPLTSKRNT